MKIEMMIDRKRLRKLYFLFVIVITVVFLSFTLKKFIDAPSAKSTKEMLTVMGSEAEILIAGQPTIDKFEGYKKAVSNFQVSFVPQSEVKAFFVNSNDVLLKRDWKVLLSSSGIASYCKDGIRLRLSAVENYDAGQAVLINMLYNTSTIEACS